MPKFQPLSEQELEAAWPGPARSRGEVRRKYTGFLVALKPGEGGRLVMEPGEKIFAARSALRAAADSLGIRVSIRMQGEEAILFRIVGDKEEDERA